MNPCKARGLSDEFYEKLDKKENANKGGAI
jgi:hypothetical protein